MDNTKKLATLLTKDTRRRQNKAKIHNTICVGHHHTPDTIRRQRKQKNTTQHVFDTTIHQTQYEDKENKKHNTTCV